MNGALNSDNSSAPAEMKPYVFMGLAALNFLIALSALIMGGIALAGVRKHGTKGILVRSILGILLSLLILSVYVVLPLWGNPAARLSKRIAGEWDGEQRLGQVVINVHMTLQPDGRARITLQGPNGSLAGQGEWAVRWQKQANKPLLLLKFDDKQDAGFGEGTVWTIERLQNDELLLQSKKPDGSVANETYRRRK